MDPQDSPLHPLRSANTRRVIVAGGGLAGCAAAFSLARALGPGRVTLLEARKETGGRARSFIDPVSGEILDNCQHLMMGCCVNLRQFTDALGLRNAWARQPYLTFATLDGSRSRFSAANMPAPLHLAGAFARLHTLPWRSKLSLGRAVLALASWKDGAGDEPVTSWLARHNQGDREVRAFWDPVLVSALNDRLERLGVRAARQVFLEAFLGGKSAFDIWLPARPLGQVFGTETHQALDRSGVSIRTDCAVRRIIPLPGRGWEVITRDGEPLQADHLVLATPHKISWELLESSGFSSGEASSGPEDTGWSQRLGQSSITAIHLWFDRRFLPVEHAALLGGLGHWAFRKAWAKRDDPYCQILISASDSLLEIPAENLIRQASEELVQFFPETNPKLSAPTLIRGRVVREKSATYQQAPGMDDWRPIQTIRNRSLSIAGDFTRTGWPATMEGAVRSGLLAAQSCLEALGTPWLPALAVVEPQHNWLQRLLIGKGT